MTNFLYKLFIKNHRDLSNPKVRESYGKLAGTLGIISNLLICLLKIGLGLFQNSIAIIADGINNLSDAASSLITIIGFKLASMPADEDHPYGHARIEYLTGMVVSMIIIFVGLQLLLTSFQKALHPAPVDFNRLTILILTFSVAVKIWQANFNKKTAKLINSVALAATAADSRNDVITTLAVLASLTFGYFSGIQVDGILGCLVALFILYSGIQFLRETSSPLLGEFPDENLVAAIREGILSHSEVFGIHDLVVHNYGPGKTFVSVHIEVDSRVNIMESHDLIDNIEKNLSEQLNIHLVAHMDPILVNDPLTKKLHADMEDIISHIDGVGDIHDFRIVAGPTHTNIIFDVILSCHCNFTEEEIKHLIGIEVQKLNPRYFVIINFDKKYS